MKRKQREATSNSINFALTTDEVTLMILLTSRLDHERFPHPDAKALIMRCRAAVAQGAVTLRYLP